MTHFANSSVLRHLRVTGVKMKAILASWCLCVYSVPSLPFHTFTDCQCALGKEAPHQGEKPCQKYALQKSSVLSAAYSMPALQFLRVSIAFPTTFFYQNMPMCRYYNKTELFCPFSNTRPRNFRERGS